MNTSREKNSIVNCLLLRAKILSKLRKFFAKRQILEVTTPLLLPTTNPAPFLNSFQCDNLYLQTSPEFAMKILLTHCNKDIYQICKAFRKDEQGRLHNPEFTILEWYRINFDHHDLMDEMNDLLKCIINAPQARRYSYREIFEKFLDINPHDNTLSQLKLLAKKKHLSISSLVNDKDTWLQLLFTHLIEPYLGNKEPVFIYDYPPSQAMLAKIRCYKKYNLASRFEVYYRGIELANGFHELNDPQEQRKRFQSDLLKRRQLNLPPVSLDEHFLSALTKLPNCSGVALGVDRLILLVTKYASLGELLSYP
ncbi:MAG: EF-P lysine aminoacylase GenX [Coxiellaceae bacterium]|nr:EF-P lysine aminoacylase GenX [Coxiellaceae bacterium]